jgi:hypothetical protein
MNESRFKTPALPSKKLANRFFINKIS